MRPFLPFATLLGAAFLLGCQEQASSPVGLEGPQFDKKGNPETLCLGGTQPEGPFRDDKGHCHGEVDDTEGTFAATITGDVISVGTIDMQESALGLQTFAGTPAILNLTFFKDLTLQEPPDKWAVCFEAGVFTAPFQIIVKKNDLPNVFSFLEPFKAKGTDGSLVKYRLDLFGVMGDGTLPPGEGEITKITWERFNMSHSSGPGRKFACTGMGTLPNFTETVVTGTTR